MCSPGINGERELRGQPANSGSPGKMAVKTECVYVCVLCSVVTPAAFKGSFYLTWSDVCKNRLLKQN